MTVSTKAPVNPTGPVAVLNCPLNVTSTSSLVLDATASYGHGGRKYKAVQWSVAATQSNVPTYSPTQNPTHSPSSGSHSRMLTDTLPQATTIANTLNTFSGNYQILKPITINPADFDQSAYIFTLTLTNFLDQTASTSVTVAHTPDPIPLLNIIGQSYRTVYASSILTVLSVANSTTKVTFSWSYAVSDGSVPGPFTPLTSSVDPSILSLPAYALTADRTYTIKVTGTTAKSSASANITVYVQTGTVTAAITGGAVRSVPAHKYLALDASSSYDSDSLAALSYQVREGERLCVWCGSEREGVCVCVFLVYI